MMIMERGIACRRGKVLTTGAVWHMDSIFCSQKKPKLGERFVQEDRRFGE